MKRIIKMLVLILILIIASSNVFAATIYAPDGRIALVKDWEVKAYEAVGWYSYPVVTMYAPDGRSIVVSSSSVALWENVGWIDGRKTATIYASDGRTAAVPLWQLESYKAVGWYDYPVSEGSTSSQSYSSYYPGISLPTFESITGVACAHKYEDTEGYMYTYYCDLSTKNYYLDTIKSYGWRYYNSKVETDKSSYYYVNDATLTIVGIVYDFSDSATRIVILK